MEAAVQTLNMEVVISAIVGRGAVAEGAVNTYKRNEERVQS